MVDFIRIKLPPHYQQRILSNSLLSFAYSVNIRTGEIKTVNHKGKPVQPHQVAYYRDLIFKVYDSGVICIEGSLHKYWNNGEHNFNDFNIDNLAQVIQTISETFKIDPNEAIINIMELGINIHSPVNIDLFLQNLFFHRKIPFKWCETQTEGNYYQAKHQQYRLKVYDKSLQYHQFYNIENILRLEINYASPKLVSLFGIRTMADLIDFKFSKFIAHLKSELFICLFYDYTIDNDSTRLLHYSNRNYWHNLIQNKSASTYKKHLNILNGYIETHSDNVKKLICNEVIKKGASLTQGGDLIKTILKPLIRTPPPTEKVCPITGFGISMQRTNSRLLSHAGLRYYREFNYNVYRSLERRFLSTRWLYESNEKKIKEIAHNIRNYYYNRKRRIISNQLTMIY